MIMRKVVTIDLSAKKVERRELDLVAPTGQVMRFNSLRVLSQIDGQDAETVPLLVAGLLAKDIGLNTLSLSTIQDHDAILTYGSLIDYDVNAQQQRMNSDIYLPVMQDTCALQPEVFIGQQSVSSNTGSVTVLFELDFDYVKLTQGICSKLAVLN